MPGAVNFDQAFGFVLTLEGGYVNDSQDPGGETKFGISKAAHPGEDIPALTLSRAKEIYRTRYWEPLNCDLLPSSIRLAVFDCAVNQGVGYAAKLLQRLVGTTQDGAIGPKTLAAVKDHPARSLRRAFLTERLTDYAGKPHYSRFGRGWTARILSVLEHSGF